MTPKSPLQFRDFRETGPRSYLEEYVREKVEDWISQVTRLAEFATSQPQASYAAFTFGLRHRETYFL